MGIFRTLIHVGMSVRISTHSSPCTKHDRMVNRLAAYGGLRASCRNAFQLHAILLGLMGTLAIAATAVTTQPDLRHSLAGRCVFGLGSRHAAPTPVAPRPA